MRNKAASNAACLTRLAVCTVVFVMMAPFAACAASDALLQSEKMTGESPDGRCGPFTGSEAVQKSKAERPTASKSADLDIVLCQKHLRDYRTKLIHTQVVGVAVEYPVFADHDDKPSSASSSSDTDDRLFVSSSMKSSAADSSAVDVSSSSASAAPSQVIAVGFITRLAVEENPPATRRFLRKLLLLQVADVPTDADVRTVDGWLDDFAKNNPDIVSSRDAITATSLRKGTGDDERGSIFFAVYILTKQPGVVESRVLMLMTTVYNSLSVSSSGQVVLLAPQPCGNFEAVANFGAEEDLNAQLARAPPSDCPILLQQAPTSPTAADSRPPSGPLLTTTPPDEPDPLWFINYESRTRNCFDPASSSSSSGGTNGTDIRECEQEGKSFKIVDGEGLDVRLDGGSGKLNSSYFTEQASKDMVGFYSTRPIYLTDPEYPTSNTGVKVNNDSWVRVRLGEALISSANRPAVTVTCPLAQLNTAQQTASPILSPPKDNFFSMGNSIKMKNSMVLTIYPTGDVWVDTEFRGEDEVFALEWACHWPLATATTKQTVTLDWTAPSSTSFFGHESGEKSCVKPNDTTILCDMYGSNYTIVDGDGSDSSMSATLVTMGDIVGFYSSQPVYVVDPDYPTSNNGPQLSDEDGWFRVSMGAGLIPSALRPPFPVACIGMQLSTFGQYANLTSPPKDNLYTANDHELSKSIIIMVYPDGNVWVDADSHKVDKAINLVWEWACQWPLPSAATTTELTLAWAPPSVTTFDNHESFEKACVDTSSFNRCSFDYGDEALAVEGSGATVTKATLVRQGDIVGFYSTQPVYFVDEGFPSSNYGQYEYEISKVSLGTSGFIPSDYRPTTPTTCVGSMQNSFFQESTLEQSPKANLYTPAEDVNEFILSIYPDGSVWAELFFYTYETNHVLQWACHWESPL